MGAESPVYEGLRRFEFRAKDVRNSILCLFTPKKYSARTRNGSYCGSHPPIWRPLKLDGNGQATYSYGRLSPPAPHAP